MLRVKEIEDIDLNLGKLTNLIRGHRNSVKN